MTLAVLYAKICHDLERPMRDIHARMMSNEASPDEWRLYTDYRRTMLLHPPSAEVNMSGN